MRSRYSSVSSPGETSRARTSRASSSAGVNASSGEMDLAFADVRDALGGYVVGGGEQPLRHVEAVEDVCLGIAEHLGDAPDLLAGRVVDLPALFDHGPGDGIWHQTARPPMYQTGPCVWTG